MFVWMHFMVIQPFRSQELNHSSLFLIKVICSYYNFMLVFDEKYSEVATLIVILFFLTKMHGLYYCEGSPTLELGMKILQLMLGKLPHDVIYVEYQSELTSLVRIFVLCLFKFFQRVVICFLLLALHSVINSFLDYKYIEIVGTDWEINYIIISGGHSISTVCLAAQCHQVWCTAPTLSSSVFKTCCMWISFISLLLERTFFHVYAKLHIKLHEHVFWHAIIYEFLSTYRVLGF